MGQACRVTLPGHTPILRDERQHWARSHLDDGPRANILIVDDNPANLLAMDAILAPLGQNIVRANSGEEALRCLLQDDYALILLDVQMTGMDGFETAEIIKRRTHTRSLPIIFVTGTSMAAGNVFQGYEAGAVDYILKPFDPDILKSKVQVFIELFQKNEEIKRQAELLHKKNMQMEEDLQMAREIQRAFLPHTYPTLPPQVTDRESAVRFCHRYLPAATLGGDFFDVSAVSPSEIGVFICDVMGHGVRSALVTAMVRTLVDQLAPLAGDPGQFLTAINRDLIVILRRMQIDIFVSALYLIADVGRGELRCANAGHPPPLHVRRGDGISEQLGLSADACGPALGIMDDLPYGTSSTPIAVDDMILLYTDGLYEVKGEDDDYGEERLAAAVRDRIELPPRRLFDELLHEIQQFSVEGEFEDDVCMIAMEIARLEVPAENAGV